MGSAQAPGAAPGHLPTHDIAPDQLSDAVGFLWAFATRIRTNPGWKATWPESSTCSTRAVAQLTRRLAAQPFCLPPASAAIYGCGFGVSHTSPKQSACMLEFFPIQTNGDPYETFSARLHCFHRRLRGDATCGPRIENEPAANKRLAEMHEALEQ